MLVSDVLLLVRYATGDMSDDKSSYYQKLTAINAANRFLRKVALEYKPSILNYTETQNTVIGTADYTLAHVPNKINSVRFDGKLIGKIEQDNISDLTQTGTPTGYYMTAYNTISFFPIPDAVKSFSVYMVEGSSELTESTTLPWSPDIADVIVSYAVGMLAGSLDAVALKMEAKKLLSNLEADSTVGIKSYWTIPVETDY